MKNKYNQLNIITIIAMTMIYTLHYFNQYAQYLEKSPSFYFISTLRGISIIAVLLYLINISYTSIHLNKKVNFSKIFLWVIIPTILLTQMNNYIKGFPNVSWQWDQGFTFSWFGDLYILLMIFMPVIQYIYNKSLTSKKILVTSSFFLYLFSYYYSIQNGITLLQLGNLVFLPYLPLIIIINFIFFDFKFSSKIDNNKFWISAIIITTTLLAISFIFFMENYLIKNIFQSYFSPIVILLALGIYKLVYSSDFVIKGARFISSSSYFFYFIHYTVLNIFQKYGPNEVPSHALRYYFVGLILSFMLSPVFFYIYKKILTLLKIN